MKQSKEFVFIMLKPVATNNAGLTTLIQEKLLRYGDIKCIGKSTITKTKISEHYQNSQSYLWYPLLVNYLSNKTVKHFILEANPSKSNLFLDKTGYSFAEFLRKEVIGPSNIFKAQKSHIRRMALKNFSSCFLDNLIHCSDSTKEALREIRIWYKDNPVVLEEFETKALTLTTERDGY